MSADAASAALDRSRTTFKVAAGVLGLLCVTLLHLVLDEERGAAAGRASPSATSAGRPDLTSVQPIDSPDRGDTSRPASAIVGEEAILTGAFRAADAAGGVNQIAFVGGHVEFSTGERLHTRPLRIAAAGEQVGGGRTFAQMWKVLPDVQIELRTVSSPEEGRRNRVPALCGDRAVERMALLHRRNRLDLLLFTAPSPRETAADLPICGPWRFVRT